MVGGGINNMLPYVATVTSYLIHDIRPVVRCSVERANYSEYPVIRASLLQHDGRDRDPHSVVPSTY